MPYPSEIEFFKLILYRICKRLQTCPRPLISAHLDIKDTNVLKIKLRVKFHNILRLGAANVQKGHFGRQKIQFPSKVKFPSSPANLLFFIEN